MAPSASKILDPANYKVAWIAPLPIEAKAALLMLDVHHHGKFVVHRGDDYIYKAGEINGHNVVIATFPADQGYGTGSAAALASQVKKSFPNLWFGILVGVAAGLPNFDRTPPLDIRLGDVLVGVGDSKSAGLVSYGLGKQTKDGFELIRHGYRAKTEAIVRSAITSLELEDFQLSLQKKPHAFLEHYEHIKESDQEGTFADPGQGMDKLHRIIYDSSGPNIKLVDRDERPIGTRTRVWHGPIGSGDILMRDAKMRDELRDKHNIIGLEMEAAGIGDSIPVGVIRGVCDYGDDQKDKIWQPYAAAMAAAYAKAILYQITPDRGATVAEPTASSARSQAQHESDNNIEHQRFSSTLPTYSNHMFSGREEELAQIEQILRNSPPFHQRICLYGLGSIGKSQIAFKYAQKWSTERSVFWIKANDAENLESGYSAIAHRLMLKFQQGKVDDVFAAVKECLEQPNSPPWLMVLDGADDTEIFFSNQKGINRLKYLPQAPHGQILFTSRDDRLLSLAGGQLVSPENGLRIGPMSIQDGTTLFKKLAPYDQRGWHAQILAPQGARFLDMLGGLPLAIVQATLFMTLEGKTIQDFIDLYKQVEEHDRIFEQAATDIDLQMISVLRTWEISYTRIAEAATPEAKSQAAMLLDLLGFIDSKSSPILRNLSEAEFIYRDVEGYNPMDGFKEFSERRPSLEMFKAQSNPRAILFRVFSKRITQNRESDFTSATAKLQRYSLIDEECWVPPVVHGWISLRLKAEEKCKYIKWLVEDLWHETLLCDDYLDTRWEEFLLPPNYHELVFHELPQLRHARVLLDHASSKTVLDNMTQGNYFAHDAVDLLHRLGNMLASAGRPAEGVHYLQRAIEAMESLTPRLPSTVVSERRLQLAKTRYRICDIADAVEEAKSLENETHSTKAALWLAQCLQIAGELKDASVIFQNIIALLRVQYQSDPGIPHKPDYQKLIFAASFGAASTLATMGDSNKKIEARNIIEKHLIPDLRNLDDDNTLKVVLYPEILILHLEVTASPGDQRKIVQTFMDYDLRREPMAEEMPLTGGKPIDWALRLNELRRQKRWSAIAALGETFIEERHSFTYLWHLREYEENRDRYDLLRAEIDAWIVIHYRLGTAYSELQQLAKAEEAHWAALGLSLSLRLFPPKIRGAQFGANLWRLQNILESQKKFRTHQIILSFFQTYIDKEAARRTQDS